MSSVRLDLVMGQAPIQSLACLRESAKASEGQSPCRPGLEGLSTCVRADSRR